MARGKFRFISKEKREMFCEMVAYTFLKKQIPEIENKTGRKWSFENHFENRLMDCIIHKYAIGDLGCISKKQCDELLERSKQKMYKLTIITPHKDTIELNMDAELTAKVIEVIEILADRFNCQNGAVIRRNLDDIEITLS